MKILFFLLPLSLIAEEPATTPPPAPPPVPIAGNRSIQVEAKGRADDIVKAFALLKSEKPTLKISAHTYSGAVMANIVEVSSMPNGTWLIFRTSTAQGTKIQFVSVDDVIDLFYS